MPGTPTATSDQTRVDTRLLPPWHVVLWDDDAHTYHYVQAMMIELFGHSPELAWQIAEEVDVSGRAIVCTTHHDRAELKADQIRGYGDDPWMGPGRKSSPMRASIEPAE